MQTKSSLLEKIKTLAEEINEFIDHETERFERNTESWQESDEGIELINFVEELEQTAATLDDVIEQYGNDN